MGTNKDKGYPKSHWKAFQIFLVILSLLFLPDILSAENSIVNEQNLRNAILEKSQFTNDQLNEMDLNLDNKVDTSDLIKYLQSASPGTPFVYFDEVTQDVNEKDGTIKIRINFSEAYSGDVSFNISGSAVAGQDYTAFPSSISVHGVYAEIPVTILDDSSLEEEKDIIITLSQSLADPPSYIVIVPQMHTVRIQENDARWKAVIDNDGAGYGFEMEIIQSGNTKTGAVYSDGTGAFPQSPQDGWDVQFLSGNQIKIGPINEEPNRFGVPFQRIFTLVYDSNLSDFTSIIQGNVTELIFISENSHLNRTTLGKFLMSKVPSTVEINEPSLEPVQ